MGVTWICYYYDTSYLHIWLFAMSSCITKNSVWPFLLDDLLSSRLFIYLFVSCECGCGWVDVHTNMHTCTHATACLWGQQIWVLTYFLFLPCGPWGLNQVATWWPLSYLTNPSTAFEDILQKTERRNLRESNKQLINKTHKECRWHHTGKQADFKRSKEGVAIFQKCTWNGH